MYVIKGKAAAAQETKSRNGIVLPCYPPPVDELHIAQKKPKKLPAEWIDKMPKRHSSVFIFLTSLCQGKAAHETKSRKGSLKSVVPRLSNTANFRIKDHIFWEVRNKD